MAWIARILLLALLLYLAALLYLYFQQRRILFHPTHETRPGQGFFLGRGEERIWVESLHPEASDALIYFPGNAEKYWESPRDLAIHFPETALYFPHYRGYGASSGTPSQEEFFHDALRLYDRVKKGHRRIFVLGRSLGSGIALYLAAHRPVDALILTTPYDSILRLGQENYPLFPIRWMIKDPFESWRYAGQIEVPTLILLAEEDRIIPRPRSEALIRSFQKIRPRVLILPHTDHGDIIDAPDYYPSIHSFLRSIEK